MNTTYKFSMMRNRQRGFTLIELGICILLVGILALVSIPKFKGWAIKTRITPVAEDMNAYVAGKKVMAQTAGSDPYTGLTQASFAKAMRETRLKTTIGSEVVRHNLGGGDAGTVTIFETGSQYGFTFAKMNAAGCPALISQMESNAKKVTINGSTAKSMDDIGNVTTEYSENRAEPMCTDGDTNEVVFTYD